MDVDLNDVWGFLLELQALSHGDNVLFCVRIDITLVKGGRIERVEDLLNMLDANENLRTNFGRNEAATA